MPCTCKGAINKTVKILDDTYIYAIILPEEITIQPIQPILAEFP